MTSLNQQSCQQARIQKESEEFIVQKEQLHHVDTLSVLGLIIFCRVIDKRFQWSNKGSERTRGILGIKKNPFLIASQNLKSQTRQKSFWNLILKFRLKKKLLAVVMINFYFMSVWCIVLLSTPWAKIGVNDNCLSLSTVLGGRWLRTSVSCRLAER